MPSPVPMEDLEAEARRVMVRAARAIEKKHDALSRRDYEEASRWHLRSGDLLRHANDIYRLIEERRAAP